MIKQPPKGSRNVNDMFLESEKRKIDLFNEALGDINLTLAEESSLIWLAGWETSTVKNIIAAFEKAIQARMIK